MVFFVILLIVLVLVAFSNLSKLKNEMRSIKSDLKSTAETNHYLKTEVFRIQKLLENGTTPTAAEIIPGIIPEIAPEIIESPVPESITINEIVPEPTPIIEVEKAPTELQKIILSHESTAIPKAEKVSYADIHIEEKEEKAYVESAFSIFIKKAEKQFADNWTGILGTAIMVLGIGYLSIYTALKVAPVFRVLILWLYAGLLMGCYYFLNKNEKWMKTGLWLRSAGASLFLFGCFGASQIPALAFLSNDAVGYSLLGLGIALNLYIGYIIKQQTFLSLHVVLSMLILCVIPDKLLVTFLLAAITATIGIVLSYKEKWEYHLLIVITAFIIFDIWFNAEGTGLTRMQNIFAIIGIILVFASCMFMQYRAVYENTRFEKAAFATHLTNWILFSVGLLMHSTGSHFKTFILFAAAIACFFIALRARKKNIFWLYHLDGMVSFILFALSAVLLNDWHVGLDIIACILYLVTVVCLFVVYNQKEALLHKIFTGINHLAAAGLIVFSIVLASDSLDSAKINNAVVSSSILALLALSVPVFTAWKKYAETPDPFYGDIKTSVNGLLSIALSVSMFISWKNQFGNAFFYVMIVTALLWCFLRLKFESRIFDIGRLFFFASGVGIGIIVLANQGKLLSYWIYGISIVALIAFNWNVKRFDADEFIVRFICIIGFNALLLTFCCKYLSQHPITMVFSFFAIALLNHEFLWFHFKRKSLAAANEFVLYGLYYAFVFVGTVGFLGMPRHYTNMQIGLVFLGFSVVEGYVLFSKRWKSNSEETLPKWKHFNLLNSELLIFNALFFGFSCLKPEYAMAYCAVLAVIIQLAFQKFEEFKRCNPYSFLLLVAAMGLTVFMKLNPTSVDFTVLYALQAATILISVVYSCLLFKSRKDESKTFSAILPYLQNLWIIALLSLQVNTEFLPLAFMVLALVNFWLIDKRRIEISFYTAPAIALLSIGISTAYSFYKINHFNVTDWALQLSAFAFGILLVVFLNKKQEYVSLKPNDQIVLNIWFSCIMFSQLEHKWLPVYWAAIAIVNLFLYAKKISQKRDISIVYYMLANLHLGFLSFTYYESRFLWVYFVIFGLLVAYIYLAYKWMEEFKLKNSFLIYPATLSIACFLYLTFDKGILTFFWILQALGLLILGIALKEKYFRYVSLSLVGLCVVRLMFFDLSNTDFLIRAMVLVGVGVVLIVMNTLFKKYKERFD